MKILSRDDTMRITDKALKEIAGRLQIKLNDREIQIYADEINVMLDSFLKVDRLDLTEVKPTAYLNIVRLSKDNTE